MPITFCQLLEEAVDKDDLNAVKMLCTAYQSIFNIASKAASFTALPLIFLLPAVRLRLIDKAKNEILVQLKKLSVFSVPVADQKDQKSSSQLSLGKLFRHCQQQSKWEELNQLWQARCDISAILILYYPEKTLSSRQEIDYFFPYLVGKEELLKITLVLVEAWYFDKFKHSNHYLTAVLFKLMDSEMLEPSVMADELTQILNKINISALTEPSARLVEKREVLEILIQEFRVCENNIRVAVGNDGFGFKDDAHAVNAAKTIAALKKRFEFVEKAFGKSNQAVLVAELLSDIQGMRSEYKRYDKVKQLETIKQRLESGLAVNPAPVDAKAATHVKAMDFKAVAVTKAAAPTPLPVMAPTLSAIATAAGEVSLSATANGLKAHSPANTPAASAAPSPSLPSANAPDIDGAFLAIAPGGPA